MNETCPFCKSPVPQNANFCPNCGKKLRYKISGISEAGLYLYAIFLPPLGLFPGFKYISVKDPRIRRIGITLLVLTTVSTIIAAYLTINFINRANNAINQQLSPYQNLGQ